MLQIAAALIFLGGLVQLITVITTKKSMLNPKINKRLGEKQAVILSILMSLVLMMMMGAVVFFTI